MRDRPSFGDQRGDAHFVQVGGDKFERAVEAGIFEREDLARLAKLLGLGAVLQRGRLLDPPPPQRRRARSD